MFLSSPHSDIHTLDMTSCWHLSSDARLFVACEVGTSPGCLSTMTPPGDKETSQTSDGSRPFVSSSAAPQVSGLVLFKSRGGRRMWQAKLVILQIIVHKLPGRGAHVGSPRLASPQLEKIPSTMMTSVAVVLCAKVE